VMNAILKMRNLVLLVFLAFITTHSYSQKNVDHQSLLWTRYQLKLKIDDHWSASQELEERTYWFPWRQHQFVSRSMAQYHLGNGWNVGGGLTYFRQALPQDAHKSVAYTQPELRPQLEVGYKQSISEKFSIQHRYWAELRSFKAENEDFKYSNIRMRYKLEFQYQPTSKVTIKAYDEIFINFGENIVYNKFDQNRIGASVQYMPLKNFGFELGFINWYQQRPSGIDFYDRNIVRFTIHQTIHLRTPKKQ
jgi:hypothetical protein